MSSSLCSKFLRCHLESVVVGSRLIFLNLFSYFILDLWNPVVNCLQEVRKYFFISSFAIKKKLDLTSVFMKQYNNATMKPLKEMAKLVLWVMTLLRGFYLWQFFYWDFMNFILDYYVSACCSFCISSILTVEGTVSLMN